MTDFSATQIAAAKLIKLSYESYIHKRTKKCRSELVGALIKIGELLELIKEK